MATQPGVATSATLTSALPGWAKLAGGVAICGMIAAVAHIAGQAVPLVGASIFAIVIGVIITNVGGSALKLSTFRIGDVSKLCLKGGIILLGASLDLGEIFRTGLHSLPLLIITMAAGLICALGLGKFLGIDWRMRCLIGMGTTICGASAIAALSPVIRARAEEIAYSVTVIFFFNMVAVFTFPALGHLLGLTDAGFGIWAGTAINDTSAVVAAGFSYSQDAGTTATIVKLTRTTMIIPLVIGFGLAVSFFQPQPDVRDVSLARRVYQGMPTFILFFILASALNSLGVIGSMADPIQTVGRWVMVIALAAVGLQGHWRAFVGAGTRPLVLGFACWLAVALTSLGVQAWVGVL